MLQSHLVLLVIFSALVSLVFSVLSKDSARDQLRMGGAMFAGFVVSALVLGWLMLLIPL